MPSSRVILKSENIGGSGHSFTVDILTNGLSAPQVTLGDNNGYPQVQSIYAKALTVEAGVGSFNVVRLKVQFESAIQSSAIALAVNISQDDATQFTFPWFSLTDNGTVEKALSGVEAPAK